MAHNLTKKELIIDECLRSKKLIKALNLEKIQYKFLDAGTPDSDIVTYMWLNPDTILVTEDVELNNQFSWDRSMLMSSRDPTPDKIRLIRAFIDNETKTS